MDKLKMQTKDLTEENIQKITSLFPELITEIEKEGKLIKTINADKLKELVGDYAENSDEMYQLTWAGKQKSRQKIVTPISKTLRPVKEDSVDFENTENLYIEGDNFEVLKLLQESYLNKVKAIYIDPPYNTGNDFVYSDKFSMSKEEYDEESGAVDEEGNKLFRNTTTNGRFHSDWLSMMYERLVIAKDLLRDDGVIFISIGEAEIDNLRKILDEIFGESNRISIIPRIMKSGGNKGKFFSPNIDYIIAYAKSTDDAEEFKVELGDDFIKKIYTQVESQGPKKGEKYRAMGLYQPLDPMRGCVNQRYFIKTPDGSFVIPKGNIFPEKVEEGSKIPPKTRADKVWRWTYNRYKEEFEKGNIEFKQTSNEVLVDSSGKPSKWNVYSKIWLKDRVDVGKTPTNFISEFENRHSAKELNELGIQFDFAKPSGLIVYLMELVNLKSNDVIIDFFSGSGTIGQSTFKYNKKHNLNTKFISIQIPELTLEDSEVYHQGFRNICEIGKERIKRAGKKIMDELVEELKQTKLSQNLITPEKFDVGFKVFRIDSSNMKDVYYNPQEVKQTRLFELETNIKEDRSELDILYQVLLDLAIPINAKVNEEDINNRNIYKVNDDYLVACFADNIDLDTVKKIVELKPLNIVFKDLSFQDDATKINSFEYIKNKLPNTTIRVI